MMRDFAKLIDQIPMTIAHYMNKRIRERWEKDLLSDPRIPKIKPESLKKRRRKASRGKDTLLADELDMLRATQTVEMGPGAAAVTNTNKKAVWHFFGVPEVKLPARDVFRAVIEDELGADKDHEIVEKLLDGWDRDFTLRRFD